MLNYILRVDVNRSSHVNIVFTRALKWDRVPPFIREMYCFKLLKKAK